MLFRSIGKRVDEEDRLQVQRTWLMGQTTGQPALILAFATGGQPLDVSLPPSAVLDADLAFFPGAIPLRALVKERRTLTSIDAVTSGSPTLAALFTAYGSAVSVNPWLESYPAILQETIVAPCGDRWVITDRDGAMAPVSPRCGWGWPLLAISGGHPCAIMGEWDGDEFLPLSCWAEGRMTSFA